MQSRLACTAETERRRHAPEDGRASRALAPSAGTRQSVPAQRGFAHNFCAVPTLQRQPLRGGKVDNVETVRIDDFDSGKATIKPQHQAVLDDAAERIKAMLAGDPNAIVFITGYTDAVDTAERNLALGQQRADAAIAYLVDAGVPRTSLYGGTLGEAAPLVDTSKAEPRNRRVEIDIRRRGIFERKSNILPGTLNLGLPPPPQPQIDLRYHPPAGEPNVDWMFSKRYDDLVKSMRAQKQSGKSLNDVAGDAAYDLATNLGLPPKLRKLARTLGEKLPGAALGKILEQTGMDPRLEKILEKVGEGLMEMKGEERP